MACALKGLARTHGRLCVCAIRGCGCGCVGVWVFGACSCVFAYVLYERAQKCEGWRGVCVCVCVRARVRREIFDPATGPPEGHLRPAAPVPPRRGEETGQPDRARRRVWVGYLRAQESGPGSSSPSPGRYCMVCQRSTTRINWDN